MIESLNKLHNRMKLTLNKIIKNIKKNKIPT